MACACSTGAAAASRRPRPAGSSMALTTRLFALQDEAQALLAGEQALTRGHLRIAADLAHHVVPIMAALRKRAERPHLRARRSTTPPSCWSGCCATRPTSR